jgi:uncharacterized damage-inducible protein DinB
MDTRTALLLARYNSSVNLKMNALIEGLSAEAWDRGLGGFFPSVHSLCNHLYIGDLNWLKRFSALRDFEYAKSPLLASIPKFSETAVGTVAEYLAKRAALDELLGAFATELTDGDLAKDLSYVDSHGTEHRRNFGGLVLHCFNHQSHHRGMVSVYLEMLGVPNDFANLMDLL